MKTDKLYSGLKGLETLQINLQAEEAWPETFRNKRVKKISSLLQQLRARENFVLSFTIDEEPVSWDSSDPLEGVVAEGPEELDEWEGEGTLDRIFEHIEADWRATPMTQPTGGLSSWLPVRRRAIRLRDRDDSSDSEP